MTRFLMEPGSFISLNSTPESDLGPKGPKSPQRSKDGTDGIKKKGKKKVITDDPDEHFSSHHANDPIPFSLKDFCNDLYHGGYHQSQIVIQYLFIMDGTPSSVDCKNLFICLDIFPELTTLIGRPNFPLKSFLSATSRILDEISASFNQVVKGIISFDILGRLEIIARLVIEKSLLAIFSANFCPFTPESTCNPFTPLLEMLITRLLVSITHSFFLISSQWLHCLSSLASTNNCHLRQDNIDLRPAVLAFFHSILRSLHQWIPPKMAGGSAHTSMRSHLPTELLVLELSLMRHSLILEILRYLEKNLLDNSGNPEPRRTIQSRIMRLAVKDTLWYICSALHTVIDLRPEKESLSFNGDITSDIYEGHHRHLNLLKDAIRKLLVSILVDQERQCSSMSSSFFLGPPTPIAHSNYMEPPEVSTPSSVHGVFQLIFALHFSP